jgi:hypothetical protein
VSNYKGHLVGGFIAYIVGLLIVYGVGGTPSIKILIEWGLCALAGSLFPDIDIKSKGQKIFYAVLLGVYILLIITARLDIIAIVSIIATSPMLVKHRGLFHKIWFVISVPFLMALWMGLCMPFYVNSFFLYAFFFTIGAISHLWLDFGFFKMFYRPSSRRKR